MLTVIALVYAVYRCQGTGFSSHSSDASGCGAVRIPPAPNGNADIIQNLMHSGAAEQKPPIIERSTGDEAGNGDRIKPT